MVYKSIRDHLWQHQRPSPTASEIISDNIRDHLRQHQRPSPFATHSDEFVALPMVASQVSSQRDIVKNTCFDGDLFVTYDTHFEDYLSTAEGRKLPVPHCIYGTPGWELDSRIGDVIEELPHYKVQKYTFGSTTLPLLMTEVADGEDFSIELIGLCTDICVVSNALILKASFPEVPIAVDAACCAGVTPEKHAAAIETMKSCQIEIK